MALLDIEHLTVGYTAPLLKHISFSAEAGELVGILGRNGCGKTTLLRGIAGSVRRFGGRVLVNGEDCACLRPKELAARISVLPQHTEVMEGISARQLIEMGRYPYERLLFGNSADAPDIIESARRLGIGHLLEADCSKLSQGQRQLVLLCRLLVQDTPVLLLDEPNAALDYDNTHGLFTLLRQLVTEQRKTALLVLHDPELALAHCHKLLLMKDGGICRSLSPNVNDPAGAEEALRLLYPNVIVREDPYAGFLRCYNEARRESLC